MNRIIVDIDNTLWDFAGRLWKKVEHHGVAGPSEWRWDFWEDYLTIEQFLGYIDEVHAEQDESASPFPGAADFLLALKKDGCHITIASHRNPASRAGTIQWLKAHNLVFDDLYIGPDKTILFDDHQAIVDDSADTLDKATTKGLIATGLRYSWNKDSRHSLFENLSEVLVYLKGCERTRGR